MNSVLGCGMEFLISRNYSNISLNKHASNDYVSVMITKLVFENYRWGGTISAWAADISVFNDGMFTYFRTNPAFRLSHLDNWTYTDDEQTLIAFLQNERVYVVMHDEKTPMLRSKDLTNFYSVEIKFTNNVVSLFSER